MDEGKHPKTLDLVGVACPLNWARAKVVLETMARGTVLDLVTDDPRAETDIPRAAEIEGFAVLGVHRDGEIVHIRIER